MSNLFAAISHSDNTFLSSSLSIDDWIPDFMIDIIHLKIIAEISFLNNL